MGPFLGALLWVVLVGLFGESFMVDPCWGILLVELFGGSFWFDLFSGPFLGIFWWVLFMGTFGGSIWESFLVDPFCRAVWWDLLGELCLVGPF